MARRITDFFGQISQANSAIEPSESFKLNNESNADYYRDALKRRLQQAAKVCESGDAGGDADGDAGGDANGNELILTVCFLLKISRYILFKNSIYHFSGGLGS